MKIRGLKPWQAAAVAGLLLVSACAGSDPVNQQAAIDNAMDTDAAITAGAEDQADHLDQKAEELTAAANAGPESAAASLRNEAAGDLAAAAAIRRQGAATGAEDEDEMERNAGVLNGQ